MTTPARPQRNSLELICFDLGRVLIRVRSSWAEACAAAGVPVPAALDDPATRAVLADLRQRAEIGELDAQDYATEFAALLDVTPAQVLAASAGWLDGPYEGADELIDTVRAAGLRTACLSNTNDHHWQVMHTPGNPNHLRLERLDYRFASHLVGWPKPAPQVYAHVEHTTGVPPGHILLFDDRPENCAAAAERGWHVLQIDPTDPVARMRAELASRGVL